METPLIGISYLLKNEASIVQKRLQELDKDSRYDGSFWEETLYDHDKMIVMAREVLSSNIVEINTSSSCVN